MIAPSLKVGVLVAVMAMTVLAASLAADEPGRSGDAHEGAASAAPSMPQQGKAAVAVMQVTRVTHVRVAGDWDSAELARDFAAAVNEAGAERAQLIVVEADGDRARTDVVRAMLATIRGANVPTAVLLHDQRDKRVGVGQLVLALAAGRSAITPGMSVRGDVNELRELAPEPMRGLSEDQEPGATARSAAGKAWQEVESAAAALLRARLVERGLPERLAADLITPIEPTWLVPARGERGARIFVKRGEGAEDVGEPPTDAVRVWRGAAPALTLELTSDEAVGAGLVDAAARDLRALLLEMGARGVMPKRVVIASELPAARKDVAEKFEAASSRVVEARERLREISPSRGGVSADAHAKTAAEAERLADDAMEKVEAIEKLMERLPELLTDVPPGATDVGGTPARRVSAWRSRLQGVRDDVTEIREAAAAVRSRR